MSGYLVLEDGVSYKLEQNIAGDGETIEVVDFVFRRQSLVKVTVTVVAKKDKAEAEGTAGSL